MCRTRYGKRLCLVVRSLPAALLAALLVGLAGCAGRELMPTPNLYVDAKDNPFADVPLSRQTPDVDLLYVTDRELEPGRDYRLTYGWKRSPSIAYGSCTVDIGRHITWEELVAESRTDHRSRSLPLALGEVFELGRFPPIPLPLVRKGDQVYEDPEALSAWNQSVAAFHEELRRRLAETRRKEVFVFVHGYHNTFQDSVFAGAELWHFLGREGVFLVYSWPAGSPGLLRGYTHDRESGEFTTYHLKEILRALADCSEVQRIHLIAHSRGNDVLLTAFRELLIETRAAAEDPLTRLRVGNLVAAAPDLDVEVFSQRFSTGRLPLAVERATVYVSSKDKAIGLADWLFNSERRLGQLQPEDIPPRLWESMEDTRNVAIVDARVKHADKHLHSYFRMNPACSSDVILVLRYDRDPGAENGRPLIKSEMGFWILEEGYPGAAEEP
jgi:esterase/lipase superfamily enzyme